MWTYPAVLIRDVHTDCTCKDMQTELKIHVGVDLSCNVLDVMYTLNELIKICNQNYKYMLV